MKRTIFLSFFFVAATILFSCEKNDQGMSNRMNNVPVQKSEPFSSCETAFARKTSANHAYCFTTLDLNLDNKPDFNQWGWSNGPLTDGASTWYNLYASAGQCDPGKGVLVGRMDVHYYNGTVNIVMSTYSPYLLDETHLYIGNTVVPRKNRKFTVAPGQYPFSHDLTNAKADFYTVTGVSGSIFVIMHAVVCGVQ